MKTKIMGVVTVMLVLGTAQVARATLVDSNSVIRGGVEYYLQTDKFVYELGEDVVMLYRVTNLTENPVDIGKVVGPPTGWYHSVITDEEDKEVRHYGGGFPILPPVMLRLQPYESIEYERIWDMVNNNNFLVGPGRYNIMGELNLLYGERFPVSVSIEIIPEPTTIVLLGTGFVAMILGKKGRYIK